MSATTSGIRLDRNCVSFLYLCVPRLPLPGLLHDVRENSNRSEKQRECGEVSLSRSLVEFLWKERKTRINSYVNKIMDSLRESKS